MSSYSYTYGETFTRTHARYLASKVITDLYQCARLYGRPRTEFVESCEQELVELLAGEYVESYEFGFEKDGKRVVSWQYRVTASGFLAGGDDDRAGGIYGRADVSGAASYNFLSFSDKWKRLSPREREAVEKRLPFLRSDGSLPRDGNGYWTSDRTYSNGGVSVGRKTFRPL